MIPKAELQKRVEEQDRQLQLIYKYNPSLRNLEENIQVLQSLGLDEKHITEVISTGRTYVADTITNPLTGEEMAIFVEDIFVKEDGAGQYGVFIGSVPYREFFSGALLTTKKLEEISRDNPEIKAIYEENLKLKSLLAQISRKG